MHVYSFGIEDDGVIWIAMELVDGITLAEWFRTRGPMPLEVFVPFFECLAEVVQAAHARGIIHRDLKPSNIMVIEINGRLFPKLLDLGIAKLSNGEDLADDQDDGKPEESDAVPTVRIRVTPSRVQRTRTDEPRRSVGLTRPGVVIGSALYMSPEQWRAPYEVGPAADIYSLGCVAYEALSGRVPFVAANTREYCERHLRAEPPPLGETLSPNLDQVLRRALAKSPEGRQASALALATELRAVLRAEPRQQLRAAAQQWHDRARPPGLLWGCNLLAEVERQTRSPSSLSDLECSFVAASQRRARRTAWARRSLIVLSLVVGFGLLQCRSATQAHLSAQEARLAEQQARLAEQQTRLMEEQARATREVAEARITESELEQGRAALLHGDPQAIAHLAEAYKRAPSSATAFMLARSMQPRLAERARFASTHGRMWWATFSPDGSQVATTDDRAAQIWDGQTYRLLHTLPHGCEVSQAIYSADGTRLVTVAETMVRIWDTRSGALVHDLKVKLGRRSSVVFRAAISPDGRFVAAMDSNGSVIYVWDATRGDLLAELPSQADGFPALVFSRDGYLATTGGLEVRIVEVGTWKRVLTLPGPVRSLAFDSRSHLLTGAATGEVALWATPSGARLQRLRPFGEPVEAVAFSPSGELVAAGSHDGAIQVWSAGSGALVSQLHPRRSKILGVEFDRASKFLLAANSDGTVVVADAAQGLPVATLEGPRNVVNVARFDASSRIVGASWDGSARVWDATSPYRQWTSESMSEDCEITMRAEVARRFMAVGCKELPTRVWDAAHDRLLAELPSVTLIRDGGYTSAFPVVSADGDRAAIARGSAVQVYELPGGRLVHTVKHGAPVSAVAFASGGRDLVSGAIDGSVLVSREDDPRTALQLPAGIDALELLPDGRIVAADAERHLRVYSPDGAILADLELPARILSLRPDGTRLVALPSYIGNAASPLLVDLERYRVVARLDAHVGMVFSARWVLGQRLLTAGADGTARLWDSTTGRLLQTYRGGARFLADATLMPKSMVIAGDADGRLHFWDEETGKKLWMLQAHRSAVIRIHVEGDDLVTRGLSGEVSRWRLPKPEQVIAACGSRCAIVP